MNIENLYDKYKPLLFAIAYRMTGSAADAEDMVQDTFLGAQELDAGHVSNIKAYLCKMVTNRCIDYLKSARKRRELYVGNWLPEPLILSEDDPLLTVERNETLSYAFLVYLEKLTPVERALFILREAFDYDYTDLADLVGKSEASCRQIISRLKKKQQLDAAPHVWAGDSTNSELAERFMHASSTGNMELLIRSLTEDVVLYSDGGGKVIAAINPIQGRERVVKFLIGIGAKASPDRTYRIVNMNGQHAILVRERGAVITAIQWEADRQGCIRQLFFVRNPDKLPTGGR
ncbi:RNA polymerase sigma-70 factor [Paenibacillus hexagrammi]|uniref:RNA polymerase sigma-70 factor n=1 Tax=Paenibacillus hexagrammi TaxID=2908839 RepID=A0ABY3SIV3_9BACL|nr:RNA polymerase sigma-70 factor [Paenibacillus sp. YPD9-1]UJF32907.1 RNA polymerase sigma-70 factor [Paenibacillus sp. YPD9-1]